MPATEDPLLELSRQVGVFQGADRTDASALQSLLDTMTASARLAPLGPLDERRVERDAETAERTNLTSDEGHKAAVRFLDTSRPLMGMHGGGMAIVARRACVALKWVKPLAAWECGRVLRATKAETSGKRRVLDAMVELQDAGYDSWSLAKADRLSARILARKLLSETSGIAQGLTSEDSAVRAYCVLAKAQSQIGDTGAFADAVTSAEVAASQIREAELQALALREVYTAKDDGFFTLGLARAERGDVHGAKQAFALVKERFYYLGDLGDTDNADVWVGIAMVKSGDIDGAMRFIVDKELEWDDGPIQFEIAKSLVSQGEFDRATEVAEAIYGTSRVSACCFVAEARAKAGEFASFWNMEVMTSGVDSIESRALAYCEIAESQAGIGDLDGANTAIGAAKAIAVETEDVKQLAVAHCAIAKAYAKIGNAVATKQHLQTATGLAARIANGWRETVSRAIAAVQAQCGDYDGARLLAVAMDDAIERVRIRSMIAKCQLKAGDTAGAKQTIESAMNEADTAEDRELKIDIFRTMAEAMGESCEVVVGRSLGYRDRDALFKAITMASISIGNCKRVGFVLAEADRG